MGVPSVVPQSTARIPVPETTRPNLLPRPQSFPRPRTISPRPSSNSSGSNVGSHSSHRETVGRLTRELWDTRREVTALQAREKVILDELDTMGARPNTVSSERSLLARDDARVRLSQTEAELRQERVKRLRAERALHDVERECRAPFVVPALFQAFMSLSELSG
ncbi:hypothetical protein HYDPIDRAFT_114795 [Hydnomerulius pinastri MD-312]|uniref:Uncharacterized protein n=1 Tax=Hydnomerulius pinastri MD-312 TaxID=994086 RepID=A0A0C9VVX0_9AGAM|nr:hypothetical protein HYDPIDRAFT_114795 [Hydnomerulius pinastri MD-312]